MSYFFTRVKAQSLHIIIVLGIVVLLTAAYFVQVNKHIFPLFGQSAQVSAFAQYPQLQSPQGLQNPSVAMGLNGVNDWSPAMPFLNLMKYSRDWIGHVPGQYGGVSHEQLVAAGSLDEHGWVRSIPSTVSHVGTIWDWADDTYGAATTRAGKYVLKYDGEGDVRLNGAQNEVRNPGRITFELSGNGSLSLDIWSVTANNYPRNIVVVKEEYEDLYDAGAVFNPAYLEKIKDLRQVRFMDWMEINNSQLKNWADRRLPTDVTWSEEVPVEIQVRLANEIGADAWFNIPFHASDDFVEQFAAYVHENLDPSLKAYVEFSNEVWNSAFGQSQDAGVLAQSTFKVSEGAGVFNYYGKRASEVMKIWTTVYGTESSGRLVRVVGTHTANSWITRQILEAPMWQEHLPGSYVAPKTYFDALAVTTYFGGTVVVNPAYRSLMLNEIRTNSSNALNLQRDMTAGDVPGYTENSIPELASMLDAQKAVADEFSLALVAYEGGQHEHHSAFISIPESDLNSLQNHLISFVRSNQIVSLYEAVWEKWQSVGEGPFMQFSDMYTPNKFGSWGIRASLTDNPPRAQLLDTKNATVEAWWEQRGGTHFQQGRVVSAGSSNLSGTTEEDYILGGNSNETIYPGAKNDGVNGGGGTDTVLLTGTYSRYEITARTPGYTVEGPDGFDYVTQVEQLYFSDGTLVGLDNGVVTVISEAGSESEPVVTTNRSPVAAPDLFVTDAVTPLSGVTILANDYDLDHDELSVKAFTNKAGSQGGTFSVTRAGAVSFNPGDSFAALMKDESRDTTVNYEVADGDESAQSTITVTVFGTQNAVATTSATVDIDKDTILDAADNCPYNVNTNQRDTDNDDTGDVCDAVDNAPTDDDTPAPLTGSFPLSHDAFFIGHSLVASTLPTMVKRLNTAAGGTGQTAYQVINGAPLKYNWDHSATAEGGDARAILPRGEYEVVVMTEAIPLANHLQWNDSTGYATRFYNEALTGNPAARTYLYETWHCLGSGTAAGCDYDDNDGVAWRTRLVQDRAKWELIITAVNQQKQPTYGAMKLIPAGTAMGELYDEIQAGRVPGITNINQFFKDDIHPNDIGFYFVSLVQYATIYGRSPVGLTAQLQNEWGGNYTAPNAALAKKLQEIAWSVVSTDSLSGVSSDLVTTPVTRNDDSDTILNATDNCPFVANQNQRDEDRDGAGDVCDATPNGETEAEIRAQLLGVTAPVPPTGYVYKNKREKSVTNSTVNKSHTVKMSSAATECDVSTLTNKKEADLTDDVGRAYPIGFFDMSFQCVLPGETVTVDIVLDKTYDTSAWELRKYSATDSSFATINPALVSYRTVSKATVITYTITDGGALDEDGLVNGVIVDPVGPAVVEDIVPAADSSTVPTEDTSSSNPDTSDSRGGSSGGSSANSSPASPKVVSPSTSIPSTFSFDKNISFVQQTINSPVDVTNLEKFLNEFFGEKLTVNGVYESSDVAALKRFQNKYAKEVLDIWNLGEATGYVGITTRLKMNFILKGQSASCPVFTEYNGGTTGITQSAEIGKTQAILKQLDMYSGPINNQWDKATNAGLITFQETFHEVMLDPWKIKTGTGYKYKTTNMFLNYFAGCDTGAVDLDGEGSFDF